jgi:hypothetical protein
MNNHKFSVQFTSGLSEDVRCGNSEQARILAQAKQIEKGNSYVIKKIEMKTKHGWIEVS